MPNKDAHRKARQAAHESVTLTGLYNVLDKLRRGEPQTTKEKAVHELGLVGVLLSLHDDLDAAVAESYGWTDLSAMPRSDEAARAAWIETLLERLVALNAKRAAEEAAGTVRWLRPQFQDPARRRAAGAAAGSLETLPQQTSIEGVPLASEQEAVDDSTADPLLPGAAGMVTATPQPWPTALPDQVRVVAQLLAASPSPLPLARIEGAFKGRGPWKKGLPRILDTLEAVGRAQYTAGGWRG